MCSHITGSHTSTTCTCIYMMSCCRHVNHFTSMDCRLSKSTAAKVYTPKGMIAVIEALAPPAIITKVPMPSLSTKQILSMVDAVTCPICLDTLHQPIELPCNAYVCNGCLTEWICVPAAIQSPVFSRPSSNSLQS